MIQHADRARKGLGVTSISLFGAVAPLQLRKMGRRVGAQISDSAWSGHRFPKTLAAFSLCLSLAACGFHLRGQATLPFDTLYIPGSSPLVIELKRNIAAGTRSKIVAGEKDAKAILGLTNELREKVILSFSTSGLVREYQLRYRVGFRLFDVKGRNYLPPSEIQLTRDVSFNEGQVLAKEAEDALLYRDMQTDMVQQIIRRVVAARVPTGDAVE